MSLQIHPNSRTVPLETRSVGKNRRPRIQTSSGGLMFWSSGNQEERGSGFSLPLSSVERAVRGGPTFRSTCRPSSSNPQNKVAEK